jgi:hypothetical protein
VPPIVIGEFYDKSIIIQVAPLDIHTDAFYLQRKELIDIKLDEIKRCKDTKILLDKAWENYGISY